MSRLVCRFLENFLTAGLHLIAVVAVCLLFPSATARLLVVGILGGHVVASIVMATVKEDEY